MPVISVTGRKGGVGKSTISAHLAGEFVAMGKSVAVFDTDPQHSLVSWASLGDGLLAELVQPLDMDTTATYHRTIARAADSRDVVIIDTPPGFADPALQAALVSDLLLLPVGPSPLDIMPARDAVVVAREARDQRGGKLPLIGLVPSKVGATNIGRGLPEILANMGEHVLPGIGQRAAVANATVEGMTVQEHAHRSKSAQEFNELAVSVLEILKDGT